MDTALEATPVSERTRLATEKALCSSLLMMVPAQWLWVALR